MPIQSSVASSHMRILGPTVWGLAILSLALAMTPLRSVANALQASWNSAISVSAGGGHTCVITPANGVVCWGDNTYGELGDNKLGTGLEPVDVTGLGSGVQQIDMGAGYQSCAVTDSGVLKCWGLAPLGDGTTSNHSTPTVIGGLLAKAKSVSLGVNHGCTLLINDNVECWGENGVGQVGDGSTVSRLSPVPVTLPASALAVSAGSMHSCVLLTTQKVMCWGRNLDGELGDETTTNRSVPGEVHGLPADIVSVSAGGWHTCALTSTHDLWCWGDNYHGELGVDGVIFSNVPVQPRGLANSVKAVAAGGSFTCVLTTSDSVKCWGIGADGELGNGANEDSSLPVDVYGLSGGMASISAGGSFACATTTIGAVKCWGWNYYGQLGDRTRMSRNTPVVVIGYGGQIPTTLGISGQVVTSSGQPVPGVTLLLGSSRTTLTDANGAYTFTNVITGTYTITPTKANTGFTPVSLTRSVPPSRTTVDFKAK